MGYCLICYDRLIYEMSWQTIITFTNNRHLCRLCKEKLEKIKGNRCKRCSRQSAEKLCYDCVRWQEIYKGDDPLLWNYSLYTYNDFIKDIVVNWKYRGDEFIVNVFAHQLKKHFNRIIKKRIRNFVVVPIPLSPERLHLRGFNQAASLASFLDGIIVELIKRVHSEKQSKKTRIQRLSTENPFKLVKQVEKPVVLVDDIYTTGRTLRHAATLLKEQGCPQVYSYTLIRG